MKNLITLILVFTGFALMAQSTAKPNTNKYKIIMQITTADTTVQKGTIKQIYNALAAAPNSKIELVCHNGGISLLQISKSVQAMQIKDLKAMGVVFAACENTLRDRNIPKTDILSEAIFVPAGIIEVVDRQTKDWIYVRAAN